MPDFDDFLESPPVLPKKEDDGVAASRSLADDILDAVDGISRTKNVRVCPKCGSKEFQSLGATVGGGTTTLRCRGCRLEIPWATTQSAAVPLKSETISSGPFYTGGGPKPSPDHNLPPNRIALEKSKK